MVKLLRMAIAFGKVPTALVGVCLSVSKQP
jgi:hypothetical protein